MSARYRNLASWTGAAAIFAVLALAARHWQPATLPSSSYSEAIQQAASAAGKRNLDAERAVTAAFEASWSARVKALHESAARAAADLGSYGSAMRFAWLAMKDQISHHNEAAQELQRQFEAALGEDRRLLAADAAREFALYEVALSESTATLAHDLGQPYPGDLKPLSVPQVTAGPANASDEMHAVRNSGYALPFDAMGVPAATRPIADAAGRASAIAARLFAPAASAAARSGGVAAAGAGSPFTDVIAILFVGFSAYQVWDVHAEWAHAMERESQRMVDEIAECARASTAARIADAKATEIRRQQVIVDSAHREEPRSS